MQFNLNKYEIPFLLILIISCKFIISYMINLNKNTGMIIAVLIVNQMTYLQFLSYKV